MTWAGGVWGGCGAAVRPGGFWLAWVRDGATWGWGATTGQPSRRSRKPAAAGAGRAGKEGCAGCYWLIR
jgi:hypothetical protein